MPKTKIYTAGPIYPANSISAATSDGRCLAIWSRPIAVHIGLRLPSVTEDAIVERDKTDDFLDIIVNVKELTKEKVIEVLTWIFGPIDLV